MKARFFVKLYLRRSKRKKGFIDLLNSESEPGIVSVGVFLFAFAVLYKSGEGIARGGDVFYERDFVCGFVGGYVYRAVRHTGMS